VKIYKVVRLIKNMNQIPQWMLLIEALVVAALIILGVVIFDAFKRKEVITKYGTFRQKENPIIYWVSLIGYLIVSLCLIYYVLIKLNFF
jgi:hypothetical protein